MLITNNICTFTKILRCTARETYHLLKRWIKSKTGLLAVFSNNLKH